jgi:hypothetical protein
MDDHEEQPVPPDEPLPRQSVWSSIPKRSLSRIFLLLALLGGILYLRQRATAIASCMSEAFRAPAAEPAGVRLRAKVVLPPNAPERSAP